MAPGIFISAGEASGEQYGALLVDRLETLLVNSAQTASFFGMGGPRMEAAGVERIVRAEEMAVMGITEVVRSLPRIYRGYRKLRDAIRERRPGVAVLIDFPDIHFKLARELHRLGIPVVFFVGPQLWAWKKHRIRLVQQYISRMLVIFPFEAPFYRLRGVDAEFVGHPLAELPLPAVTREQFARENDLDPAATWIGLLPGSRMKEIHANLPEMLSAARGLAESTPKMRFEFLVPVAPTLVAAQRNDLRALVAAQGPGATVRLVRDARAALLHARASVVASGTATVEAALIGNPFVVVYRVSPLTYAIARRVVSVPHVAMANLVAGKRVVPELIQSDFTARNVLRELERLLPDGPPRQSMKMELAGIHGLLLARRNLPEEAAPGAIGRVAEITLELLNAGSPAQIAEAVQS
ncbi:MAG TPA: lipid-A-disaccharide synthase [Terracidiphilus sp.]|nr:lipid-A-disaccharide synthase [Terracidiphilus sp.]